MITDAKQEKQSLTDLLIDLEKRVEDLYNLTDQLSSDLTPIKSPLILGNISNSLKAQPPPAPEEILTNYLQLTSKLISKVSLLGDRIQQIRGSLCL